MPLYRKPDSLTALELKVRVREAYETAVLSSEPSSVETNYLITLGPRSVTYLEGRSIVAQMSDVRSESARKQMAYTMLAVGHVLLDLKASEEMS
ncbi:MAG: hypothetical protein ACYTKD_28415 [Planctomycetota bacterium]|jgi:hypothetical protein